MQFQPQAQFAEDHLLGDGYAGGVYAFLASPTSANLAAAVTDETGTGLLVFNTGPTLVAPILGTPASGNLANCLGLPLTGGGVTGTLAVTNGGTGMVACSQGDIVYGSASNVYSRLAKSASTGYFLSNSGTSNNPAWANPLTIGNPVSGGGTLRVLFEDGSQNLATDSNLFLTNIGTTNITLSCRRLGNAVNASYLTGTTGGWQAVYTGGGTFSFLGTPIMGAPNDIFFQGLPPAGGYTYLEDWTGSGLVVGTGPGANPIIFRPARAEVLRVNGSGMTWIDAKNMTFGTSTGTKIGTSTTEKIGFFNATPVVQQTGASDVLASLVTLGLRAASSNPPLNLGTGALTCGTIAAGDNITIADAKNIVLNTTTGTKLGTATTQKIGLWNTAPDVQPTNAITAAAFVANTSGIVNDTATFGGYTIGQVVAALKRIGALA